MYNSAQVTPRPPTPKTPPRPKLEHDDPRWTEVREACVGPAMKLAAAHVRSGKPGYTARDFREPFTQFLAEGMSLGTMDVYKASLEGAVEMGAAHLDNGRPGYGGAHSVISAAREQIDWAATPPAPEPGEVTIGAWREKRTSSGAPEVSIAPKLSGP